MATTITHRSAVRSQDDSLAAALIHAQHSAAALRDSQMLRAGAHQLIDVALQVGCTDLMSVGVEAEALVAAALLLSDGAVKSHRIAGQTPEKVLLVDAVTVTGHGTRAAAQRLRLAGATWIGAVIYDRVRPDKDGLDEDPSFEFVHTIGSSATLTRPGLEPR